MRRFERVFRGLRDGSHEVVFVGFADGGLAVGQEDDRAGPALRVVRGAANSCSARSSASLIAVPPLAFRSLVNAVALAMLSEFASFSDPKRLSASVLNRTISNRSSVFRFARQNCSAFFACSIFSPAIDPLVSSTKQISRGCTFFGSTSIPGEAIRRKYPSSAPVCQLSRLSPTGSLSCDQISLKSVSGWAL